MSMRNDVRYAMRQMRQWPGFTLAVVLTLAIGIGANGAIFSLVNSVLLQPLPFPEADRLVVVNNSFPSLGIAKAGTSIGDYLDRREAVPAFGESALWAATGAGVSTGDRPDYYDGMYATQTLFATLGAEPAIGRRFSTEEMQPGKDKVVILSHWLARRLFEESTHAIGSDVRIDGIAHRVVGVMAPGFAYPNDDTAYIVPLSYTLEDRTDYGNTYATMLARLAPGATVQQAHAQVQAVMDDIARRLPHYAAIFGEGGMTTVIADLRSEMTGNVAPALLLLQLCVGIVLLIVCANIANLFLARMLARKGELSIRAAMGAGRLRIARQLMVECLLLSSIGGFAGLMLAYGGLGLVRTAGLVPDVSSTFEPAMDVPVLSVTLVVTLAAGILFGLLPVATAWRSRDASVITDVGRGVAGSKRSRHARDALVVAQLMLAVALLVSAGLLIRSFAELQSVEPGFRETGVVSIRLSLPESRYPDSSSVHGFQQDLDRVLQSLPGVEASAIADTVPFGQGGQRGTYGIRGMERPAGAPSLQSYRSAVSDGYFRAMQIELLAGRLFDGRDTADGQRTVIIDDIFARKHFPDTDPIGRQVMFTDPPAWTIVGVVESVKQVSLDQDEDTEAFYIPLNQVYRPRFYAVLHTSGDPDALIGPLRDALQRLDPELPAYDIASLQTRIDDSLQYRRTPMTLLAVFAGVAVLLAGIGLYGVLAFSVAQRTGEIGVRMAVGADRWRVISLVIGQGISLVSIGAALGLTLAFLLGRGVRSMLFGVGATDPTVYVSVVTLLALVAFSACAVPAWRAARVNPVEALRAE